MYFSSVNLLIFLSVMGWGFLPIGERGDGGIVTSF